MLPSLRWILLAALACACQATPPKFESRTPFGSARSDDEQAARTLAELTNAFVEPICEQLHVQPAPRFVLWHVPDRQAGSLLVARDLAGAIVDRRIEIGDFALHNQASFAVAHELVHWYACGTWDRLPQAVEEGLADFIALQLAPEWKDAREFEHELALAEMTPERRERILEVTEKDWRKLPKDVRADAYPVGYEIVKRIGVDGLRALCERAEAAHLERVPIAWLALPPLPTRWTKKFKLELSALGPP